jgi:hypothetical protein
MVCVLCDALEVGVHGVAEHGQRDFWPALKKRAT